MSHGGKRSGAGRPAGSGKYAESTKAMRVPESMVGQIHALIEHKGYKLPLYGSQVQAGFPSPADDYVEGKLDLNEHLIKHPAATFFVRVTGDSMINAGIHEDDILIVDRSLEAIHGKVVVAALDGYLTVKRLHKRGKAIQLLPENAAYKPIEIGEGQEMHIWGVVTNVIHAV